MSRIRKVVLIILAVLALMVIGAYAFLQAQLSKINRVSAGETQFTAEDFEEDEEGPDTLDSVDWGEQNGIETQEGVVNILLVGQDTRQSGERARSDSMIVLSIDNNRKRLSMVSLMRDLYVQIPGYSDNKLNAAYRFGGFELLDATIETNFGIKIDHNVEVDFTGFQEIIDAIGGIDITLNSAEVDYLSDVNSGLQVGVNHLDGKTALWYARIRKVGTGTERDDFGRTQRQRIVIQTVFQQMKDKPWNELLALYDTVAGVLTTDMNNDEILSLALTAYNIGADSIDEYRVPEDGGYSGQRIRKMAVLVPNDWNVLRANLQEFIYGAEGAASTAG